LVETDMPSRLRLQYGALQVEYEGSDEFLKTELPALLEQIARVLPQSPVTRSPVIVHGEPPPAPPGEPSPSVYLGTVRF